MTTTWHARLSWAAPHRVDPDVIFDALDQLTDYSPSASIARDEMSGSVSISIEADTALHATDAATNTVREALAALIPDVDLTGISVQTQDALERELDQPLFPEVVGYAEIADMAGVSRQRARAFRSIPGFPEPVIETAQGPLMPKAAVATWIEHRNTKSGRQRVTA